jgi:hypothetical protein
MTEISKKKSVRHSSRWLWHPLTTPDPIFEAIERHRAAYSRLLSALFVLGPLLPGEDEEQAAQVAADEAKSEADKNGMALTTTQPTSLGGVIALLRYVESFNAGQLRSPDNDDHSELEFWPRICDVDNTEGAAFVCAVMSNIRRALETAAKSSNRRLMKIRETA